MRCFASRLTRLFLATVALVGATANARAADAPAPAGKIKIVLCGDSTVTDHAGWGPGFKQFVDPARAECINMSQGGRSSKSYRDEGHWAKALALHGDYYLIQFGHNDQPGKGPERETDPATTYTENMSRYVDEVRAQGGKPILVTSITRRNFSKENPGKLNDTLAPWAEAVRKVAAAKNVPLVDLYARSQELVEKLGPAEVAKLNPPDPKKPGEPDTTHLQGAGQLIFARLVVDEVRKNAPDLAALLLPNPTAPVTKPDAVVAPDGSAQYTSLQEAISAAPMRTGANDARWIIFVKAGTYKERVYVQRERGNILVLGEDADRTIITYDLNANLPGPDGKPIGTFRTPTVQIDGDGMIWENITLANGAGPVGQALALRVDADRVIFKKCRFLGWQDTILVNRGRQYFEDCYIEGHVDFIFGAATAYFDRCHIRALRDGYLTAASTPQGTPFGYVFADCKITGAEGVKTFLGRPWRNYAKTVYLRTEMSDVVKPEGWNNWNKADAEKTAFYGEFGSTGPGANSEMRAKWAHALTAAEAAELTPEKVLAGSDGWNPKKAR